MSVGPKTTYLVTVLTGDVKYAGTDANVFIQICGKDGRATRKIKIDDAKNNFERGATDQFKVILKSFTVNELYFACTIFCVLGDFLLFSFDFYPLINAHLAVYLIWQRNSTAKGTKKITSPNVICLQYFE